MTSVSGHMLVQVPPFWQGFPSHVVRRSLLMQAMVVVALLVVIAVEVAEAKMNIVR